MIDYTKYVFPDREEFKQIFLSLVYVPENDKDLENNIDWIYQHFFQDQYLSMGAEQFIIIYNSQFIVPHSNGYILKSNKEKLDKFIKYCKNHVGQTFPANTEQISYVYKIVEYVKSFHNITLKIESNSITVLLNT